MKRVVSLLLMCFLAFFIFACAATNTKSFTNNEKNVSAIFVGLDKQLFTGGDNLIDTIWVYYDDETFEQFAEVGRELVLFSQGNYHFENGGNFIDGKKDLSKGQIVINRHKKYQNGLGLVDYSSTHTYSLYGLGFKCIWPHE